MNTAATSATHDEHRFNQGSWLALGVVLLIAIISSTLTVANLSLPNDGCLLDVSAEEWVLTVCVGDWPTPLRPGDELLSIAGVKPSEPLSLPRLEPPPTWHEGDTARYTVRRDGATLELEVSLHRLSAAAMLRAFGYGLTRQAPDWNTFAFLGALVIFALAPRSRAAQFLLVAIGGLTMVTTLLWPSASVGSYFAPALIWYSGIFLNLVWGWLFMPTVLLLVLSFPRRVWPLARYPRLTPVLIYGLPLAATAISLSTTNATLYLAALGLGALAVVMATVAVTAYTLLRVRDPVVRAQTAWLALGLAIGLAFWPLLFVFSGLFPDLFRALERLPAWVQTLIIIPPTLAFPVCLGIAITRYRLFDITVVINRTLVYGTLTVLLVLTYWGSVVLLQHLFQILTGQASQLAIVASTLAIAALFNPLRRRIQMIIDRRFYRRKYDAAQVLAAFAATARDEVDLDRLTNELVEVIEETLQPEHVSLWVKNATDSSLSRREP